jgi:hypothetical protein
MNQKNQIVVKKTIKILIVIILAIIIFSAGIRVGERKIYHSFRNNLPYKTFDRDLERIDGFLGKNLPSDRGAIGKIISVNLPDFIIANNDNTEKIITVSDETIINKFREKLSVENLAIGDEVVVIGEPNEDSKIVAVLIRVIPENPENVPNDSTRINPSQNPRNNAPRNNPNQKRENSSSNFPTDKSGAPRDQQNLESLTTQN